MNQRDVIRELANRGPDELVVVERTVDGLFSVHGKIGVIIEQLCLGQKVVFRGFGTFYIEVRKPRDYRDPRTGQLCTSPARPLVKFRPSESLQALLDDRMEILPESDEEFAA